jgi:hypothetical protein
MRFTVRQLCLLVIWLAFVLGVIRLADAFYTLVLAALSGMALYFIDRLVGKGRSLPLRESVLLSIAIIASLGGTAIGITNIARHFRASAEQSEWLQSRIREDDRFKNVVATFSGPNGAPVLTVSGHVASESDLAALHAKAEDEIWHFKTTVRWQVRVVDK